MSQLGASPVVSVLSEYDDPIFFHVCTTVFNFYCLFIYICMYIVIMFEISITLQWLQILFYENASPIIFRYFVWEN